MSTASRSPNQRLAVIFGAGSWIVPIAMSLVLTPVIVRGLGVPAYGVYALVLGFLNNTFTTGLGRGVVRECSGDRFTAGQLGRWLSTALTLAGAIGVLAGCLLAFVAFGSVSSLSTIQGHDVAARYAALAVGLAFPLAAIQQVLQAVPLAAFRFDVYAQGVLLFGFLQTGGTALLATHGAGPPYLVLWYGITAAAVSGFILLRLHGLAPGLRTRLSLDREKLIVLAGFGGPVFAYQLAGYVQLVFERWWIGRASGPEAVTYFVVPMALALQIHAGVASVARGLMPGAAAAWHAGDGAAFVRLYDRAITKLATPVSAAGTTVALTSADLISFWMGPAFATRAAGVLPLLVITFCVLALIVVPWEFIEAVGAPRANAYLGVGWLLCDLLLLLVLPTHLGPRTAAWGRLALVPIAAIYIVLVERQLFGGCRRALWRKVAFRAGVSAACCGAGVLLARLLIGTGPGSLALCACLSACVVLVEVVRERRAGVDR